MSFVEGMITNFIRGMSPEQRRQLLRSAQQQILEETTPQERSELLHEVLNTLVSSLTPEQRGDLAREFAAQVQENAR